MVRQKPAAGTTCPPPPGASKKEFTMCAAWDRVSSGLLSPIFDLVGFGTLHYYVFQIVDEKGAPVQPYYDEFMKFADSSAQPWPMVANLFGVDLGEVGKDGATSFVHHRAATSDRERSKSTEL